MGATAAGREPDTGGVMIGIVAVDCAWSGSISSVSGRSKSADGDGRRLASPTGSSIGEGGTYGAGVGGVKAGRSPGRAAAPGAGGVKFSGSMTVFPVECRWCTSHSFSSSSTGGQMSEGASASGGAGDSGLAELAAAAASSAGALGSGVGTAHGPERSGSGGGVLRIAA